MNSSIFVGLDVHKRTVSVAIAEGGRGGEVRHLGTFENRVDVLRKMVERLARGGHHLNFCYEAGPCGYGLYRLLRGLGNDCIVVAPSLIPLKAGERVKTDRRDALTLAKLHRAGELTAVWVPDAAHEAMRDLVRHARQRSEYWPRHASISTAFCFAMPRSMPDREPGPRPIGAG
jgi:transposase